MNGYMQFWGKARPTKDSEHDWHPLACHCLDVAAVALELQQRYKAGLHRISAILDVDSTHLSRLNAFLVALHDIGKFSRSFQAKVPQHWPAGILGELRALPPDHAHWKISHHLLSGCLRSDLQDLLQLQPFDRINPLLMAVAGHHGTPPGNESDIDDTHLDEACLHAAREFLRDVHGLLMPVPPPPDLVENLLTREQAQKAFSFWLAGLTVTADWLGSDSSIFAYAAPDLDLADYWQRIALPRAAQAVRKAGLTAPEPATRASLQSLFGIANARPMQQAAAEVALPDGPMLAIVEDATGSGKTEAAMLLAWRMMKAGKGGGVYFALPTMATANAMYQRMRDSYRHLFAKGTRASLVLAHGRRELQAAWLASVALPTHIKASLRGDDRETAAECAEWIADDRRKAFLAHVGIGTIDQALLAVLPSKFQSLRLWGLADRILVIDEAHAYDAYVSQELERLLQFHAAHGGSAIVLSATLPAEKRAALQDAFCSGLRMQPHFAAPSTQPATRDASYPLLSITSRKGTQQLGNITPAAHTVRRVQVERLPDPAAALEAIAQASRAGAAVAFVRNAVDDAIEAVRQLRQRGVQADLFHARYAMGDRQEIEQRCVSVFGKHGSVEERKGRVLVATQVIEQSLDLDFDLVVSDLAPIDLLIQRAGRLWRHMDLRPARNRPVEGPRLLVVSPDPDRVEDDRWLFAQGQRGAYVYPNHALLWRTARVLFDKGGFAVPGDIRSMIEYVYAPVGEAECPPALQQMDEEHEGQQWGDRATAQFNLLNLHDGYASAGNWLEENILRTRLGEPTTTIRLARIDNGQLVPWCAADSETRAWALSEISVRETWLRGAETAAVWRRQVEEIRQKWPAWQRKMLVAPVDAEGRLLLEGASCALIIDEFGLQRQA